MTTRLTNTLILVMDHADYAPECIVLQLQHSKIYVAEVVLMLPDNLLPGALGSSIQVIRHERAVETLKELIGTAQSQGHNVHLCVDVQSRLWFAQCLVAAQMACAETDCVWGIERSAEAIRLVTLPVVLLCTFRVQAEVKLLCSKDAVDARIAAFYETLSEDEQQLVALTAQGLTNRAIAQRLYRSDSTVANALTDIYKRIHTAALVKHSSQVDRKTLIQLFNGFSAQSLG